jgi:hypothetical protein
VPDANSSLRKCRQHLLDTINTVFDEVTSANKVNQLFISIVPNPTSGIVKIVVEEPVTAVLVFSIRGIKLMEFSGNPELNIRKLPQGIYFVQIKTTTGTFYKKLIKGI